MLYDRIVDNKEVGRKIWKICTAFNNDLYSVERFVLRWMICTTLNDMYYVEWFALRWVICTTLKDLNYVEWYVLRWMNFITLNDLYYVEWFVQRWMIFYFVAKFVPPRMTCTAKELYSVERFVLRWMIRSAMDDLYNVESFGQDELLSISFLMSARCTYSRKYCQIFYTYPELIFSWFWHI